MKKIIGWVLIIITLMNFCNIPFRMKNNDSLESPMFYIVIVGILILGIYLVNTSTKPKETNENDEQLPDTKT